MMKIERAKDEPVVLVKWYDYTKWVLKCIAIFGGGASFPACRFSSLPISLSCDLVAYEPGKPIEETARELGLDPETIVKLASNENPLGPAPAAIEAMKRGSCRGAYLS